MLLDTDNKLENNFNTPKNFFPYTAFGKDFNGDAVSVKVDDRVPPLFMLPPMYNGYTNYTCPDLEDEYEVDEYLKELSNLKLGPGYHGNVPSTRSPMGQDKPDSNTIRGKSPSTQPKKNPGAAKSERTE